MNYLQHCSENDCYTKQAVRFLKNETWKEFQDNNQPVIISRGQNEEHGLTVDEQAANLIRQIDEGKSIIGGQCYGS
jgi:hypothetical protein